MRWKHHEYTDSFGNRWSVKLGSLPGKRKSVSFIFKGYRLMADGIGAETAQNLTVSRLKELFCNADRVLENGAVSWRVGYRRRMGTNEQTQPGMNTWFTSERGEVRYVKGMLQFRNLDDVVLRGHLLTAIPFKNGPARIHWGGGRLAT